MHPDRFENTADVGSYSESVFRSDRNGRHAGALTASLNNGEDQFALLIAQRDLGAQKIRAAHVSTAEIRSVADGAVDAVKGFSTLDLNGIAGLSVLPGDEAAAPGSRGRGD